MEEGKLFADAAHVELEDAGDQSVIGLRPYLPVSFMAKRMALLRSTNSPPHRPRSSWTTQWPRLSLPIMNM